MNVRLKTEKTALNTHSNVGIFFRVPRPFMCCFAESRQIRAVNFKWKTIEFRLCCFIRLPVHSLCSIRGGGCPIAEQSSHAKFIYFIFRQSAAHTHTVRNHSLAVSSARTRRTFDSVDLMRIQND